MSDKNGIINTLLIAFGAIVWIALPMSVFSEKHPTIVTTLKVIGTISAVVGIVRFIISYKKQN